MRALHRIGFCLTACVPHPILRPPYFNEPMLIVNQVMLDCTGFIMQATCCLKYTTCKVRILDFAKWVLDTIDFILVCTMHTMQKLQTHNVLQCLLTCLAFVSQLARRLG